MNRAREKFFPGSALSEQQHGRVRGRHALHLVRGLLHGLVLADDPGKSVSLGVFFAEQKIFPLKFLLFRRTFHQKIQVFQIDRLLDKVIRAVLHCGHGLFHRAVRRDEDDWDGGVRLLSFAEYIQAGLAGQLQIGKN